MKLGLKIASPHTQRVQGSTEPFNPTGRQSLGSACPKKAGRSVRRRKKMSFRIHATLALSLSLFAAPIAAGELSRLFVDLDGDGRAELIEVRIGRTQQAWRNSATVRIAASTFTTSYFSADRDLPELRVVTIDRKRADRQLLISTPEASSCPFVILGYRAKRMVPLLQGDSGPICHSPKFLGDGTVLVESWQGFWIRDNVYHLSADASTLIPAPAKVQMVNIAASAGKGLVLEGAECAKTEVEEGAYIRFTIFDHERDSYRVESARGGCGWLRASEVTSDNARLKDIPWAN